MTREDERLLWRLAHGDGDALEPLMERWGDAVIDTCFRALKDPVRAYDLYGEAWAEVFVRVGLGTARIPESVAEWLVEIIGELVATAADGGQIPDAARRRLRLHRPAPAPSELTAIGSLTDEATLRAARNELPRDFSAAADLMLLHMPAPVTIARVRPSSGAAP